GITLITGVGMIGVLEITLIVLTLRVGMPLRTLRVRCRMRRRAMDVISVRHARLFTGYRRVLAQPF
ncbi:hypothetical protein, partial [Pseudomonas viridiflava]|uniref:hypothetical protein n=1 Tax=Pseudomonas viridiflava TaxID=33069 RepID=UPI00197CB602